MSGTQCRESEYGLVAREFEGVADGFIVAAVMAAGAVTALRSGSNMTNTATAMDSIASVPVAKNPESQLACRPSPNVKRPRSSCLAESRQIAARTNPRGSAAIGKRRSVENDSGRDDDEDSKPSLVTSSSALLVASYPDQEVVQENTRYKIPSGWTRVKLEPDC
jgi:hypothetical protein